MWHVKLVRQHYWCQTGVPLSLTLFGLYIYEIPFFIDHIGGKGSLLAHLIIQMLLYADDIVLILAKGLQRHLEDRGILQGERFESQLGEN